MDGTISRTDLIANLYTNIGISLTDRMLKTLNKRLDLIEYSDKKEGFSETEQTTVYHLYQMLTDSRVKDNTFENALEKDSELNSKLSAENKNNCIKEFIA